MGEKGTESQAPEDFQGAFARIESAVDGGDPDLAGQGFWKLVREVKLDQRLTHHWAEEIGRIDGKAFRARVRPLFPVWLGNAALLVGALAGGAAVAVALGSEDETVAGAGLVLAGAAWSVSWHDLAHWVVGRLVGIRFTNYFFGGPFPPRPGLKTDYATYLRAGPFGRAWMHASGALATKIAPFAALAFAPAADAPVWAVWALVGLGVLQIVTDVLFSVKSSDWKKVKRELAVARAQFARAR